MGLPAASATVDAEVRVPAASAQLVRFDMPGPADNFLRQQDSYWLDLCLTPRPRNTRGCFPHRWNPQRFERIGNVFMVPPHETMHVRSDASSSQASLLCHLRPQAVREWFDGELEWTQQRLEASLDISDRNVRQLMFRLAEELRRPGFASHALIELIVGQLAIELRRYCTAVTETPKRGGLASWRLRRIEEHLQEISGTPTLAELAALCKLSVRQLTRGFRVSRGRSIGDYLASRQLDRAKHMLAAGQSIKATAYTLGFSSPSSFCFAFRRATGQTPREFRDGAATDPSSSSARR